jgi:hypothetical protein
MAFTGTAVITQTSDRIVRITGLSLATTVSGTIALTGHTGATPDVTLPASFKTEHYAYLGVNVPFVDAIEVVVQSATTLANAANITVAKTGTTLADFRITLTNGFASTSQGLEIYVKYHE